MSTIQWHLLIDKLTNSIEDAATGESFDTQVQALEAKDLKQVSMRRGWRFNWRTEMEKPGREVYKLTLLNEPAVIQGLISIEDPGSYLYLPLIEAAPHNFGRKKRYLGVAGNLTAFACKKAFEKGYEGEVTFAAKTVLIEHYETSLGASVLFKNRMIIYTPAALHLVSLYFKDFKP